MDITIRAAFDADINDLVRLNDAVQQLHVGLDPAHFKAVLDPYEVAAFMAEQLAYRENMIRVAEIDGAVAGYVWFEEQQIGETLFTLPAKRLYVNHIAVDPGLRRRGVASALFANVETEAIARGIGQIVLDAWVANGVGQAFFQSQGFCLQYGSLRKSVG